MVSPGTIVDISSYSLCGEENVDIEEPVEGSPHIKVKLISPLCSEIKVTHDVVSGFESSSSSSVSAKRDRTSKDQPTRRAVQSEQRETKIEYCQDGKANRKVVGT